MTDSTPTVVRGPRFAQAVQYASALHTGQARKTTTIPYISHLLGAASLVLKAGGDEDMAIAVLLHDRPDDQKGQAIFDEIRELFGDRVAYIVHGCTDSLAEDPEEKAPSKERKIAYLAHLTEVDGDTLTVSLADRLRNARAIVTDLMIHGDSTWERVTSKKEGTLWNYDSILEMALASNAPSFSKPICQMSYLTCKEQEIDSQDAKTASGHSSLFLGGNT